MDLTDDTPVMKPDAKVQNNNNTKPNQDFDATRRDEFR